MDPFRDDREGLRHRVDQLEDELADARSELEREREKKKPKREKKEESATPPSKVQVMLAAGVVALLAVAGFSLCATRRSQVSVAPAASAAALTPTIPAETWTGKQLSCSEGHYVGKDLVVDVKNSETGYLVNASGTCLVEITNSQITAPRAFLISDNGRIVVHGGKVDAAYELAYFSTAKGKVELDHATAIGPELYDHAVKNFTTGVVVGEGSTWTWPAGTTWKWFSAALCRATADASLRDVQAEYLRTTGKSGPTAGAAVNVLDFSAKECVDRLHGAITLTPTVVDLDTANKAYSDALDAFIAVHKKAYAYYRDADYRDDALAQGKKMHPELVASMTATLDASKGVRAAMDREREAVQADLTRAPKVEMAAWSLPLFFFDVIEATTKPEMRQALEGYIAADATFSDAYDALSTKPRMSDTFERARSVALVGAKQARRTLVDQNTMPELDSMRPLFARLVSSAETTFPHR